MEYRDERSRVNDVQPPGLSLRQPREPSHGAPRGRPAAPIAGAEATGPIGPESGCAMTNSNPNDGTGSEHAPALEVANTVASANEPMVADPDGEARSLRERMADMREEAKTADPKRRGEIGWWLFGATKHLGRLSSVKTAQSLGEHQFVMTEGSDTGATSRCSCGAAIAGEIRVDITVEEFLAADGHLPMAPDDALVSPLTLRRRLRACGTDVERITVIRAWIVEIEHFMATTSPGERQSMSLWVWAAQQHLERLTSNGAA